MPRFSISQYSQISQLFFIFHFPPFPGFSPTIFNPLLNYGTTIKLSRSANKNKTLNSLLDFSSPTTSPPIHPKLDSHSVSPTKPRWSHQNQLERFARGQIFDFLWSFTRLCAWKSLPDVRKHVSLVRGFLFVWFVDDLRVSYKSWKHLVLSTKESKYALLLVAWYACHVLHLALSVPHPPLISPFQLFSSLSFLFLSRANACTHNCKYKWRFPILSSSVV